MGGKLLALALSAALLASCSSPFGANPEGYETLGVPLAEAWARAASFRYMPEDGTLDYWKSPNEFEADGGGDCEDFAAYMVYLLGPEASVSVIYLEGRGLHAVVSWEGRLLEPQAANGYWSGPALWSLDYWYVMSRSTAGGTKSVR